MSCFLSHAWYPDESQRDVHAHVCAVADRLRAHGVSVWMDVDMLRDDIDAAMARGIARCTFVVVFVTRAYCEKVQRGADDPRIGMDNCYKEFSYAALLRKPLVPVVLERSMRAPGDWPLGIVKMHAGPRLYVDACDLTPSECALAVVRHIRPPRMRPPRVRPSRIAPQLIAPRLIAPRLIAPQLIAPRISTNLESEDSFQHFYLPHGKVQP